MEDIENAIEHLEEVIKCSSNKQMATKFEYRRRESQINEEHNLFSLGHLGKDLHDLSVDVVKLAQLGKSKVPSSSSDRGTLLRPRKLVGDTTPRKIVRKIWDHLMDDNSTKIGIYGAKGIGKTIIMELINDCLIEDRNGKFNKVIWVTVSEAPKLFQLQNDIAFQLGLNPSKYKDVTRRAEELHWALRVRNRYVIILDGMCENFHLTDIGIPEFTVENECKLILTTQSSDICKFMKCDTTIHMGFLSKEEAWELFLDHVKHQNDVLRIKKISDLAKEIFEEYCLCLPLSIVKVANGLDGEKKEHDWRNAQRELNNKYRGPDDKVKEVTEQLKSAYPCLQQEERLYDCLLYFSLFPQTGKILRSMIINMLIEVGIIKDWRTIQEQMDEGNHMLDTLREFDCLKERGAGIGGVKTVEMHDTIRFMVQQITRSRFMIDTRLQGEGVGEIIKWSKDIENLSVVENNLEKLPTVMWSMEIPILSVFILHSTSLVRVRASFIKHLNALKMLDLSCTKIKDLPDSISDLVDLVVLLLNECRKLRFVPSLGKMKSLRRLDLSETSIRELPEGLTELTNLRILSLCASGLEIPDGSFSKLSRLQVLEVLRPVRTEELMGLKKLEYFSGTIPDIHSFNEYIKHKEGGQKLDGYDISVGYTKRNNISVLDQPYNKSISACVIETDVATFVLPEDVEALEIRSFETISSVSDIASCLGRATNLRSLIIKYCSTLEFLLPSHSDEALLSFESLEILVVDNMPKMRNLISRNPYQVHPPFHYSCLKRLRISGCPELEEVFQIWFLEHLKSLEEIHIVDCEKMVRIIGGVITLRLTLPKLKTLILLNLPLLETICPSSTIMICNSLQGFLIRACPKLKRIPFCSPVESRGQSRSFPCLQKIYITAEDWESLEWPDQPNAKKSFESLRKDP